MRLHQITSQEGSRYVNRKDGNIKTMKGRDLQQDSVATSTAKHQNTQSETTDTTYTARDAKVTRYIKYDVKTLNTKRLLMNQRATGADFGRPSAKLVANGVVIRIAHNPPTLPTQVSSY